MRLIWRQGIRPSYRWQFWRQLLGIYRQNPSRLKPYLMCCSMGEDLFALRRDILKEWHELINLSPRHRLSPVPQPRLY